MQNKDYLWLHLKDLPYFRAMLRAVEAQFYQGCSLPAPTLDVGCGDGHFATIAFDRPLDVGIDPWAGPIHKARQLGSHRLLIQGDAGLSPFPDATFASALSNSVLEHIPHIDRVLEETARVLKPRAPFIFCVPNPRYFSELSIAGGLNRAGFRALGRAYTAWFRRISRVHHADEPDIWKKRLENAGRIAHADSFVKAVLEQESLAPAAFDGVAAPLARGAAVRKLSFAIGLAPQPIRWIKPRTDPVHTIVLFAVPLGEGHGYLRLMRTLADFLDDESAFSALRRCVQPEEMLEILSRVRVSPAGRTPANAAAAPEPCDARL